MFFKPPAKLVYTALQNSPRPKATRPPLSGLSTRSLLLLLAIPLTFLLVFTVSCTSQLEIPLLDLIHEDRYNLPYSPDTLGIASRVYVLTLFRRHDRRVSMDYLRLSLGLNWSYVGAFSKNDPAVISIERHLKEYREKITTGPGFTELPDYVTSSTYEPDNGIEMSPTVSTSELGDSTRTEYRFDWPDDLDSLAPSDAPLARSGSDPWTQYSREDYRQSQLSAPSSASSSGLGCTTENLVVPSNNTFTDDIPPYLQLTTAKIACWHSHLEIIRAIAENDRDTGPAIILEDDVDIEWSIRERLNGLWDALPDQWDIVFLGHCWSDESRQPSLRTITTIGQHHVRPKIYHYPFGLPFRAQTSLHPAVAPKCTHAYVVSHTGARRILLHLRHLPFAYSRAIDQAYAWLISSGRLKAFSVVPSLVVQRKIGRSDVWVDGIHGPGSKWKDVLADGVFGSPKRWAKAL